MRELNLCVIGSVDLCQQRKKKGGAEFSVPPFPGLEDSMGVRAHVRTDSPRPSQHQLRNQTQAA